VESTGADRYGGADPSDGDWACLIRICTTSQLTKAVGSPAFHGAAAE
jgi:hypothetical protein